MNYGKCWTAMSKSFAVATVAMGLAAGSLWAAQETVLHTFVNGSDGSLPFGGLTFDANGNLYGTADLGGEFGDGAVYELTPDASGGFTFQTIHSFSQAKDAGGNPQSGVVFDTEGNLYGTTTQGGTGGCGIAYELSPPATKGGAWTETILHNFGGVSGCGPSGYLIFDQEGNLYGTTFGGGGGVNTPLCTNATGGCGTVYKLSKVNGKWTETTIHHFTGENLDGQEPSGGLVFDQAGNLWGATYVGGNGHSVTCGDQDGGVGDCGTVFELTPEAGGTWKETTLFSFSDDNTGFNPFTNLVIDKEGHLYGTAVNGGNDLGGLVFKLTPEGSGKVTESIVHQFDGGTDGLNPFNGLTMDAAGNLYGAVQNGGGTTTVCVGGFVPIGCGVVYKLTPNSSSTTWTETILYDFLGSSDGAIPLDDRVAVDANGNVFGTASAGGDFNFNKTGCAGNLPGGCGVVFEVKP